MTYCTLQNLITRFSVDEIAQLAAPKSVRYIGEAASASALAATFPAVIKDDLAYVGLETVFYLYSGTTWAISPLAKVTTAITDAQAEIDGYLTSYLPLVIVSGNLVRIACDIARYYLYDDAVTEPVQTRYDQAIKYLSQVAKGQISLGPDTTGTLATSTNDSVEFISVTPIFGRDGGGY